MSDDFDKRRPPDDESDEESFDWQKDQPKQSGGASSGESLGFTGELNWRKDVEDAFEEQLDAADEDALDWQKNAQTPGSSSPQAGGLGFTGQLDWKKAESGGDEPGADEDNPLAWMNQYEESTSPESDPFAEVPASQPAASSDEDDPLAWLNQYEEPAGESPGAASQDFSDSGDDPFAASQQPAGTSGASDEDDPLAWLNQYSAGDEPAAQPPEESGGAALPSWLDDAGETSESPSEAADVDLPPWLSEAAPEEKPITEGGQLSADWLAGADEAPETASADMSFDEWQRLQDEMTRPRDIDEEMPDLFSELDDAPPVSAEDLPQSDTGQLPSWVLGMEELDAEQAPDWLSENEPVAPPPAAPAPDDIFGELGLPTPETGYDFLDQPAEEEDLLAGLNLDVGDTPDWFAETEQPAASKDAPDWLSELGDLSESAAAQTLDVSSGAVPAEDDFLAELRGESKPAEINPMDLSGLQDIDSLLASYELDTNLPSTDDLLDQSAEAERLLSDDDIEQISARRSEARPGIPGLSPDAPDWLAELGASVDEVSAAAIVRKQTQRERPLDELPDRLQALHDAGLELPSPDAKPSEVLRTLLPGVTEVLPPAPLQPGKGGLIGDLVLTDAQREKINLLRTLVGTDDDQRRPAGRPAAIDLTLATPNLADLGIDETPELVPETEAEAAPVSRARRGRRLPRFDRLIIGVFLTAAVILPFLVSTLRIGDLPPAQFLTGSRGQAVFEQVDQLDTGELALIAAEYGPTGAGELDAALDALFRHVLMRGARPVVVSGNPVGLLHARNVLDRISGDAAFLSLIDQPRLQANRDYYVVRFLAANAIGLRAFSQNIPRMLAVDANGQATNLNVQSLRDFGLIAVIAENAEEIRAWAEQIAPLAGQPLVAVAGQSAAPLSEPYVLPNSPERLTGLSGLLVGYRDAYTYRTMLDRILTGAELAVPTVETPTVPPATETPVEVTPTVEGGAAESTEEIIATETDAEASPTPEGARSTSTTPPTASSTPAPTGTATLTPTTTPTPTLTPTVTPTFEPALEVRGVIDAAQAVNVREGPGTSFVPIASLSPGTIVRITGRNADGSWLQVLLEDGREGWVSASLISVEEPRSSDESGFNIDLESQVAGLISDVAFYAPAFQAETPTPEEATSGAEATPETTAEATEEATAEPTTIPATPVVPVTPSLPQYRDERWYGMTLGLVAIIVVITLGMIVNILRGLFRKGK